MRWLALLLLSSWCLALSACYTPIRQSFTDHALSRASFEMECPRERLRLTGLNRSLDEDPIAGAQVGVSGCERRSVYVYSPSSGWVLNSASHR